MPISNRDAASLLDMIQIIEKLRENLQGVSYEFLLEDWATQKVIERSFEILGEAARRLSDEFRDQHSEVNWRGMIGLRNIISHQYEAINYRLLWDIITTLPDLQARLEALLPPLPEE